MLMSFRVRVMIMIRVRIRVPYFGNHLVRPYHLLLKAVDNTVSQYLEKVENLFFSLTIKNVTFSSQRS